ncbi:hypothetical protein EJB05_58059, partial [Eragrostis curvula]
MVLRLSFVAWYDSGAGDWCMIDVKWPYRLALLSEGRIDDKGTACSACTMDAEHDVEGGDPIKMKIQTADIDSFLPEQNT